MISPEVIVAVATAISAGAGGEVLRSLFQTVRRRVAGDKQREAAKAEIAVIVATEGDDDSAKGKIISALEKTSDAVVVVGDRVIIKDSATGTPKVVVRNLSADQREKISSNQAPMKNAALFHAWLDDTRQPEESS
jgi:protein-disulfide isomerase